LTEHAIECRGDGFVSTAVIHKNVEYKFKYNEYNLTILNKTYTNEKDLAATVNEYCSFQNKNKRYPHGF
jgi:hypothetical protein